MMATIPIKNKHYQTTLEHKQFGAGTNRWGVDGNGK